MKQCTSTRYKFEFLWMHKISHEVTIRPRVFQTSSVIMESAKDCKFSSHAIKVHHGMEGTSRIPHCIINMAKNEIKSEKIIAQMMNIINFESLAWGSDYIQNEMTIRKNMWSQRQIHYHHLPQSCHEDWFMSDAHDPAKCVHHSDFRPSPTSRLQLQTHLDCHTRHIVPNLGVMKIQDTLL